MNEAQVLCNTLLKSRGFIHKRDISTALSSLIKNQLSGGTLLPLEQVVPIGDDCAAIDDGHGGYQLFAIEGLVEEFIENMPWFAGYCSVMVNVSDIYAMGGRPTAVVNAIWSNGSQTASKVFEGMAQASRVYSVPIVGGHSNYQSQKPQLAVSILGHAKKLLTSFDAKPGEELMVAIDLRGHYQDPYPYWNASTESPALRLRGDLELLPYLAESELCKAAKDISMAGVIGTALMLLECSQVGAVIDVESIPKPKDIELEKWLTSFPSYGFILSVSPKNIEKVKALFTRREIACSVIGQVTESKKILLKRNSDTAQLWDLEKEAFICAVK